MKSSTVYVVFVIIVLILFVIYIFLLRLINFKTTKYLADEHRRISIFKDLFTISITTNQMSDFLSKKYPNIHIYLSQATQLTQIYGLDIYDAVISPGGKKLNNYPKDFNIKTFIQEYSTAPKKITELVDRCSSAFEEIYRTQHPYKYAYIQLKKKKDLQILSISLSFLKLLIHILNRTTKTSPNEESPTRRVISTQEKLIKQTNEKSKTNHLLTVYEVSHA